jgi:hypothetical protein
LEKAEESDYYIVRFNELFGKTANDISVSFPAKIIDAYEVNGQEQKLGDANFTNGTLNFDMTHFEMRSFAVKFEKAAIAAAKTIQQPVTIPFNEDVISTDGNRLDGNLVDSLTISAELIPSEIVSEGISFKVGSSVDGAKNAVSAKGQKINLPQGDFNKIYILAAATEDTEGTLKVGSQKVNFKVQDWTGWIGQHYGRKLYLHDLKVSEITNAYVKRDNIAWYASHRHSPKANDAYQYSYLYKYEIDLPKGAKTVTLPANEKIKVFGITVAKKANEDVAPLQPLYDDFRGDGPVKLRVKEYVTADLQPMKFVQKPLFNTEKLDERLLNNRRFKAYLKSLGMDTVVVKTPPATTDYADAGSGNKVSVSYYATGKSNNGKDYLNQSIDVSNLLNSKSESLVDTVWFNNGEGRYVFDLQKAVSIDKINLYLDRFRERGNQVFSMWVSDKAADIQGDPKAHGWRYVGIYGIGGGWGSSNTILEFEDQLKGRYLMFLTDGGWHGNDYLNQVDIFTKD